MNLFKHFRDEIISVIADLAAEGLLPADLDTSRVNAEPPREAEHGDVATNAALVLAKPAGQKPRDLAALLAERLDAHTSVIAAEVAGPGFINLRLADRFWHGRMVDLLQAGTECGRSDMGAGQKVNVEYVSANPTGPLHVGHGRGAVFGDALASVLEMAGYDVTREYYVNDAGAQVDILARSAHLRYRETLGEDIGEIPEGLYPGDYLREVGAALATEHGDKWREAPEEEWLAPVRQAAIEAMMALIRDDLDALGVRHAVFTSEHALVEAGRVDDAYADLDAKGLIYTGVLEPPKGKLPDDWEARPQTLFRATEFGDDVDRPLRKSDGTWTYFATDVAYHLDKYRRGFTQLIDVWGADHGGYVKRVEAAMRALAGDDATLDVKLCQMVRLMREGEPVKMSKRSGSFVTLREVVDEVGKDVVRFIMLTRRNDAALDFDLVKVTEQSRDNPVFYVQYAHARCCSVMRHAAEAFPGKDLSASALSAASLDRLNDADELALIKTMAGWPRVVEGAAEVHEPHRIAFYLYELASQFHALWNKGRDDSSLRFILADQPELSRARLAMVQAMRLVVASGLQLFGVEPAEEMR